MSAEQPTSERYIKEEVERGIGALIGQDAERGRDEMAALLASFFDGEILSGDMVVDTDGLVPGITESDAARIIRKRIDVCVEEIAPTRERTKAALKGSNGNGEAAAPAEASEVGRGVLSGIVMSRTAHYLHVSAQGTDGHKHSYYVPLNGDPHGRIKVGSTVQIKEAKRRGKDGGKMRDAELVVN